MSTTSNPSQKAAQQSAATYASSQPLQIGAIQGNLTVASSSRITGGPFGAQRLVMPGDTNLRSEILENEVFGLPVARMIDLWVTKFSNDWVDIADLEDDQFWYYVYARLKSLGEVETHYLTDRARYVCRKPL